MNCNYNKPIFVPSMMLVLLVPVAVLHMLLHVGHDMYAHFARQGP